MSYYDIPDHPVIRNMELTGYPVAAFTPYKARVDIADLRIRCGPGTNYASTGDFTGKGIFTIIDEKPGAGSAAGWGKLKSGAGWISLDYTTKV